MYTAHEDRSLEISIIVCAVLEYKLEMWIKSHECFDRDVQDNASMRMNITK